jgi:hypothetical protein
LACRTYLIRVDEEPAEHTGYLCTLAAALLRPRVESSRAGWSHRRMDRGERAAGGTAQAEPNYLNQTISRLLGPDEMRAEDIAILTATKEPPFSNNIDICGMPLVSVERAGTGRIVFETIREFKGLERSLVVLLNPEDCVDDPEQMYTALTRARSHLVVIGAPESMALMRQLAEAKPSARKR